jgi:hypothetical protein
VAGELVGGGEGAPVVLASKPFGSLVGVAVGVIDGDIVVVKTGKYGTRMLPLASQVSRVTHREAGLKSWSKLSSWHW